jgi:hypothetical protein
MVACAERHALATWWQTHRGELTKDLIIGVVVGGFLLLGGMVWDKARGPSE